jgi:hypothetical protein
MNNTNPAKLRKSNLYTIGDKVEIVNKSHVGYGYDSLILIEITKARRSNKYFYVVQNDNALFYCEFHELKKV